MFSLNISFIRIIFIFCISLLIGSCNNTKYGFADSDCSKNYRTCKQKCPQQAISQSECRSSCLKAQDMCIAIKRKGCLQKCVLKYNKGNFQAKDNVDTRICKKKCYDAE